MRIAVEGCLHGELDTVYQTLRKTEKQYGITIDLLLICGDFQSVRNELDMAAMNIKDKYRELGTFHKYYSGQAKAPYPTVFIGGNHEASNFLYELFHGGWVAPNMYFLGFANVIRFGPLRISGLTGIYNPRHYNNGFYEREPLSSYDKTSVYHVRKFNVYRLAQLKTPLDVFLSHDWPRGVAQHGNIKQLLSIKRFLENEIRSNTLGSPAGEFLLNRLKPSYWFAAHLHVKFAALVIHGAAPPPAVPAGSSAAPAKNPDEIDLGDDDEDEDPDATQAKAESIAPAVTSEQPVNEEEKPAALEESPAKKLKVDDAVGRDEPLPPGVGVASSSSSVAAQTTSTAASSGIPAGKIYSNGVNGFPTRTRFLSLDKVLPHRQFLQVLEFETADEGPYEFSYDQEWLAIVKATNSFFSDQSVQPDLPRDDTIARDITTSLEWVKHNVPSLEIPHNFVHTAPILDPKNQVKNVDREYVQYCRMLDMQNKINPNGLPPAPKPPVLASQPTQRTAAASSSSSSVPIASSAQRESSQPLPPGMAEYTPPTVATSIPAATTAPVIVATLQLPVQQLSDPAPQETVHPEHGNLEEHEAADEDEMYESDGHSPAADANGEEQEVIEEVFEEEEEAFLDDMEGGEEEEEGQIEEDPNMDVDSVDMER
ncbi:hypothetical protein SmJEL517_g02370 [Synchytrium microbalum]|uniref:Lariat debranching enzyme C-terminal domain-containing protein n=1 Tax=Synchytrium microbalum TaxID=1806994 RepID=A0A507CAP9_9FUNG|nr:uncharacterized protein SmJEL517_g02370 [Synchytrium microbalum]TPX35064.1 hypothetical protein SmJEL517_g02370 [Synchytrium microbalum]